MSRKRKKKKNKIILFAVEIFVLAVLLVGLFVYSKLNKVDSTGEIGKEDVNIELDSETAEVLEGYTNIALFGLDNRDTGRYDGGNSDCIMIASINNDTKKVKLISVYRDTFLNVKEETYNKINSAYSYGGPKGAIAALNRNLNLDIVNYVAVDFGALVEAIDLLDGIELTLTDQEVQIMNDNYIDEINQVTGKSSGRLSGGGTYRVDGVQALAYCRIRYTAGDDFKRTERQRLVLTKMIEKAKGSSIATVGSMINSMIDEISTSYTSKGLLELASSVMDYELEDTHGWPFELCTGNYGSKGSLVVPTDLETNVKELHEYLFDEKNNVSSTVSGISDYIVNYTGCTTDVATRLDNPLTGDDNTSTTDTGYTLPEESDQE
ncbi:polyisoprenyl-teichoic acid--peptidoglycan teichoic acid transferase TagT [Lachnospiraceae bacterium]|mgnify:FL=1|jgi:LCP family protein required for cell wall assembly|nr:LCP family protein [Eubacterium sp.]GFI26489.1 polyisoprenyl-teichoic acid--peptidoglycan teichoic acid transferase TagT [Lachnospiraceae bacterium]